MKKQLLFISFLFTFNAAFASCKNSKAEQYATKEETTALDVKEEPPSNDFYSQLSNAAISIIDPSIKYTPDYIVLPYPNGDVPSNTGVCTDVVIRAYRKLNIDLQKLVHEDMKKNFNLYPKKWGLKVADKNIDHRRVPNLMTFFTRFGKELPMSQNATDYHPGDIVTWVLSSGLTHIGIVVNKKSKDGTPMMVHNIGGGQVMEDCLFSFKITGHYRYGG